MSVYPTDSSRDISAQHPPGPRAPSIPGHSRVLRAALEYGHRRKPVFPCKPDKSPYTRHGFKDATTSPSRIHALWGRHRGANIGMATGERAGVFVVDADDLSALEALEGERGKLPSTLTARTPRGGLHLYFRHVEGITNSPGSLPRGIDVRGEGGYVVVPPSAGYAWDSHSPVVEAPEWLVELIRERRPAESGSTQRPTPQVPEGETIPEGRRNNELARVCGRLHDGTRDPAKLVADLLAINGERCEPPLPANEVEKIARSIHKKDPCRPAGGRDPQVDRHVRELERFFWRRYGENFKGLGGQSDRDLLRKCLDFADRFGRINGEGRVEFDMTAHQMALDTGISRNSINTAARRLKEKIGLDRDTRNRKATAAGTWVLPDPAQLLSTQSTPLTVGVTLERVDKACAPPRVVGLETPCYRHFGTVGKGRGGVQLVLESWGPSSAERLAGIMGVARVRDVRRRYLDAMVEEGQVELRDGVYSLPADHADRCDLARSTPYSRVRRRKVRTWSPDEGRHVVSVVEIGAEASEKERDEMDRRAYAHQREVWMRWLARNGPEADDACRELLNDMDRERERVAAADGLVSELEHTDLLTREARSCSGWRHADAHLESLGFDSAWLVGANPEPRLEHPTDASDHGGHSADSTGSAPPGGRLGTVLRSRNREIERRSGAGKEIG